MAAKQVSSTLLVFCQICNIQESWCTDDRSTAVLFGPVMVMCVSAPDSAKDLSEYEKYMQGLKKVTLDGRKGGAKRFFVPCDLNIELGFLCTEDDETKDFYGPPCWCGTDADPGVFKKSKWLEIVEEFKCKVGSTWLTYYDCREKASTTKHGAKMAGYRS